MQFMKFKEIVKLLGKKEIVYMCGVTQPTVTNWLKHGIPEYRLIVLASRIEELTNGKVTRKQLCPNLYKFVWTNLQ